MKLLIVGSRSIKDFDLSGHVPAETEMIISGGAKGIDTVAEQYADAHGIEKQIFRPQYRQYGQGAPLKRNEEMVLAADAILAVWDGRSTGTAYTLQYARSVGKRILEVVLVNEAQA